MIRIDGKYFVYVNDGFRPKCVCREIVTTMNKDGCVIDYDFQEIENTRHQFHHYYRYENDKWYVLRSNPFNISSWYVEINKKNKPKMARIKK